jgi:adenosylcobyric acid synthase
MKRLCVKRLCVKRLCVKRPFLDGCRTGAVWGTSWHGTLENDEFRRAFLTEVASLARRDFAPAPDTDFAAIRQQRLDLLGDLMASHLDTGALCRLIEEGAPPGLPVLPPAGVPSGLPVLPPAGVPSGPAAAPPGVPPARI